jgi:hypothetical protein
VWKRGDILVVNPDDPWLGTVVADEPCGGLWTVSRNHDGAQFPIRPGPGVTVIGNIFDLTEETHT